MTRGPTGEFEARFGDAACDLGRFRLRLTAASPWVDETPLASCTGWAGTDFERELYLKQLPRDARGYLERALASPPTRQNVHLKSLAELLQGASGSAVALNLLDCLAAILSGPLSRECQQLPWWQLTSALASMREVDAMPLLEAVAAAPPGPELVLMLASLDLPRWRALHRLSTAPRADVVAALWARWPALGAAIDLRHGTRDWPDRVTDFLGLSDLRLDRAGLLALVGHLGPGGLDAVRAFSTKSVGHALLGHGGWERCVEASRTRLRETRVEDLVIDLTRHRADLFEQVRQECRARLGCDFIAPRYYPVPDRHPGRLPAMSLAFALWTRMLARGIVTDRCLSRTTVGLTHALMEIIPEMHTRDLCLAGLILARTFSS